MDAFIIVQCGVTVGLSNIRYRRPSNIDRIIPRMAALSSTMRMVMG